MPMESCKKEAKEEQCFQESTSSLKDSNENPNGAEMRQSRRCGRGAPTYPAVVAHGANIINGPGQHGR